MYQEKIIHYLRPSEKAYEFFLLNIGTIAGTPSTFVSVFEFMSNKNLKYPTSKNCK